MSKDSSQSHNLSRPPKADERVPTRMHHRLAVGKEKVTGQSNPYGAEKGSTTDKIANGKRGNY